MTPERFLGLVRDHVPGLTATKKEGEYLGTVPWRPDTHPSLAVNVTKMCWVDRGTQDAGGWLKFCERVGVSADDLRRDDNSQPQPQPQPQPRTARDDLDKLLTDRKKQGEAGLLPKPQPRRNGNLPGATIVETYDYTDAAGALVHQVVRLEPKTFRQRQSDGNGGWLWHARGVETVPYRLPELLDADRVYICEGEKDCDLLHDLGFAATTNPMGAGKWPEHFAPHFLDKEVVCLPDNDSPGRAHMQQVAAALEPVARRVVVCTLPGLAEKGDVADFLTSYGEEELREHVALVLAYTPTVTVEAAPPTGPPDLLCPDTVWSGPYYSAVADTLGVRSWGVWLGATVAASAWLGRAVRTLYHGPLHCNVFGLLVSGTGAGKSICTETARALLPPTVRAGDSPQSGQALGNLIADVERDGGEIIVTPQPATMICEEWSKLARLGKMSYSHLLEDINKLYDFPVDLELNRSDRDKKGGRIVYPNPELTICATTTTGLFREETDRRFIQGGFINRFLILPGEQRRWAFHDTGRASMDYARLPPIQQALGPPPVWQSRTSIWAHYTPDAAERLVEWGKRFEAEIMNAVDQPPELDAYKRLHVYAHKLSMLYAALDKRDTITVADVECAVSVVDTSWLWLDFLLEDVGVPEPPWVVYEMELAAKVRHKVVSRPGEYTRRELKKRIRGDSKKIGQIIETLIEEHDLIEDVNPARGHALRLYPPSEGSADRS